MIFTAIGNQQVPKEWLLPALDIVQAGLVEFHQGDGTKRRLFGEIRTAPDGTTTFTPQRPTYVLMPPEGGENGDK